MLTLVPTGLDVIPDMLKLPNTPVLVRCKDPFDTLPSQMTAMAYRHDIALETFTPEHFDIDPFLETLEDFLLTRNAGIAFVPLQPQSIPCESAVVTILTKILNNDLPIDQGTGVVVGVAKNDNPFNSHFWNRCLTLSL